jgi:N-acetylglucosamine-6-sulfatase
MSRRTCAALASALALASAAVAADAEAGTSSSAPPPNFLVLVLDDMDDGTLGALSVMPTLSSLVIDAGATFSAAHVGSPICCPSRTSQFTGRHTHNLGDVTMGWCGNASAFMHNDTFLTGLKVNAGYAVAQHGKWYNSEPTFCVPGYAPGWFTPADGDDYMLLCQEGKYFNNSFNDRGRIVQHGDAPGDYMTSLIGNRTVAWLANATRGTRPWLAYVTPHAPHLPSTPAPWYADAPVPGGPGAPRLPNWNTGWANKTVFIDNGVDKPMSPGLSAASDALWAKRLRALMSVDDLLADALAVVSAAGALDNTYVIVTSDHGYHLGSWGVYCEKSTPFDQDSRVLLAVRGPRVPPRSTSSALVSVNVDLPATILDLAGVPDGWPDGRGRRDGVSFAPLLAAPGPPPPGWRDRVLIQFVGWVTPYEWLPPCAWGLTPEPCGPGPDPPAGLVNAANNVYTSLRIVNSSHDVLYAEYRPPGAPLAAAATNWTELYDVRTDPWFLANAAVPGSGTTPPATLAALSAELWAVATCAGATCP